jgi:putative NIF3 family GTP cyclohydrolase 1 type 2
VTPLRVQDIAAALAASFPLHHAEEWDNNGLLAGDPQQPVTRIALALDPTVAAIESAADAGANVLVTHHPAFLTPPTSLTPASPVGRVLSTALSRGVALVNAHTNLDRSFDAQSIMPTALGLVCVRPLEDSVKPMALVTTYLPETHVSAVLDAMVAAGAGRIGRYEHCSFRSQGTATFLAPSDAAPCCGTPGALSRVQEVRLEAVCPRDSARGVETAVRAVHPYEEPLVTVTDTMTTRGAAALGMVADAEPAMTLGALAAAAAAVYGVAPRVWGDPGLTVSRVVTATGSAGSLVKEVARTGAQARLAGEVRYHDALDATAAGLAVVEVGHDVSEWPLVGLLERVVRSIPGLADDAVVPPSPSVGWWIPSRRSADGADSGDALAGPAGR